MTKLTQTIEEQSDHLTVSLHYKDWHQDQAAPLETIVPGGRFARVLDLITEVTETAVQRLGLKPGEFYIETDVPSTKLLSRYLQEEHAQSALSA